MKVAFIGLGSMGHAMANNLAQANLLHSVYNRTRSKAEDFVSKGVRVAETPADATKDADVVLTMLADDKALEEVAFGKGGLISGLKKDAIHVSMSTISVEASKRLAREHREKDQGYLAAPVFGRPEAAQAAKLWIAVAGHTSYIERARPVFEKLSQGIFNVGDEPWKANMMKLSGNFLIAAAMESMSEVFALFEKNGVDARAFHSMIASTLFKCPIYENYGKLLLDRKFDPAGFKLKLGLKDVSLLLKSADASQVPMPTARLVHSHYLSGCAQGLENKDWSALLQVVFSESGVRTLEHA